MTGHGTFAHKQIHQKAPESYQACTLALLIPGSDFEPRIAAPPVEDALEEQLWLLAFARLMVLKLRAWTSLSCFSFPCVFLFFLGCLALCASSFGSWFILLLNSNLLHRWRAGNLLQDLENLTETQTKKLHVN